MIGKATRLAAAIGALALGSAAPLAPAGAETAPEQSLTVTATPLSPDWFGTVALPCDAGRFAERWSHASGGGAAALPVLTRMVAPARNLTGDHQVAFVQAAVHAQVRWLSDATQWGERDYWARAGETLARGGGDDEDRAIVKLQALRALGFPARDLYLTIGRDPVGGQTILLMVRSAGRMWALDDLGGSPIPAERRVGFKPQLTLAMGGAWLHGVRVNSAAAVAAR